MGVMGFDYIVVHVSYHLGGFLLYVFGCRISCFSRLQFFVRFFCLFVCLFFKPIFVLQLVLNLVCLQKEVILRSFY